jgi:4-amino-4-deoxy-L-arabinose transferase-like glycosyltransferase
VSTVRGVGRAESRVGWLILACLLAVALAPRLVHLAAPPIGIHSWRQSDTAGVARNYFEGDYKFAFPQIDWGRPGQGYVETEFPIFPFTSALGYGLIGGVQEWIPRLLAVFASLVGLFFLHRLIAEEIDERTAHWAALLFAVLPLNIYYSRTIMPEAWMLASGIAGIYFFARWSRCESGERGELDLVLSWFFITLSCLMKLPMLHIGLPLLYLAWRRHRLGLFGKASVWLYGVSVLSCVALWYLHAWWIRQSYGLSFGIGGSGKWADLSPLLTLKFYETVLLEHIAKGHLTLLGVPLVIAGIFMRRGEYKSGLLLFDVWAIAFCVFLAIAAVGNIQHEYYQMPMIPVVCLYMARALAQGPRWTRFGAIVLLAGVMLIGANKLRQYWSLEDPTASRQVRLAELVQERTPPDDLVIVANGDASWDPTLLYLSHRKGWADHPRWMPPEQLASRISHGARWLIGRHGDLQRPDDLAWLQQQLARWPVVFDDGEVFILELAP